MTQSPSLLLQAFNEGEYDILAWLLEHKEFNGMDVSERYLHPSCLLLPFEQLRLSTLHYSIQDFSALFPMTLCFPHFIPLLRVDHPGHSQTSYLRR